MIYLILDFDKNLQKGDSYCSGKSTHHYDWKVYTNRLLHNNGVNFIFLEKGGK